MDDLHHRLVDKIDRDLTHLENALDHGQVELALSIAKRGRRDFTLLVRAIAAELDATSLEATSE